MRKKDMNLTGNDKFEGFCIDLLKTVADSLGFQYELYLVPDAKFGAADGDGNWNGLVRELMDKVCKFSLLFLLFHLFYSISLFLPLHLYVCEKRIERQMMKLIRLILKRVLREVEERLQKKERNVYFPSSFHHFWKHLFLKSFFFDPFFTFDSH